MSGRTGPCQCHEEAWGSKRLVLFRGGSLQIDHRIRGEFFFFFLQVGNSFICEVTCRTGRRVILPLKCKIFKYRTICNITDPYVLRTVVLLEGIPKNHASVKKKKLEERLKRNKAQYISLFAQFLAGSLGSVLVPVSLNPDIL